jgi:DNA-binding NtrC family response regulator
MTTPSHILVIDGDAQTRHEVAAVLTGEGHRVSQAANGKQALDLLSEQGFHLVITELALAGAGGLEILAHVREHSPHTPVMFLAGSGSLDAAVEAMRRGAFDFQSRPLNLEHLLLTVGQALEKATLHKAFDYLRHEQPYVYRLEKIDARSSGMQRVLEQVTRVAGAEVTVLLTGETGTGKSLVAGAIHANSSRRERPLVTVNCAALPETLLESELFGHEKGAFTGAHKYRTGRFEQAHGGTLFLDEIGDMSPATQAKVLRAIEDKVVQRVGGVRSIQVDVRIIAATNVDLGRAVQEGRFREDLFYRLNVAHIHIPPLRERQEDIYPLAEGFLERICAETNTPCRPFAADIRRALEEYTWPGNIRQLRNAVERAVLFFSGSEISPRDLGLEVSPEVPPSAEPVALPTLELKELERLAIATAIKRSHGVQARAAALLGITPRALYYKLNKLDIEDPDLAERRRRQR